MEAEELSKRILSLAASVSKRAFEINKEHGSTDEAAMREQLNTFITFMYGAQAALTLCGIDYDKAQVDSAMGKLTRNTHH